MKLRYLIAILAILLFVGFVSGEKFTPSEGDFAFKEVENYTLHGINFTVPVEYKLKDKQKDSLLFKHGKDKLKITVKKNGKIKKVKSTKKIKAEKETTSIGFDFYATVITLNENMEIEVIHQDYDVAQ